MPTPNPRRFARIRFITDTRFLASLVPLLFHDESEEGLLVSGPEYRRFRMLSFVATLMARVRTPVYYESDPRSMLDALFGFQERGNRLLCWVHCHPFGEGPSVTTPSAIDFHYLESLQEQGSEAIGLIYARSLNGEKAWVRAFSVYVPFRLHIHGTGFAPVAGEKHVYELDLRTPQNPPGNEHDLAGPVAVDSR